MIDYASLSDEEAAPAIHTAIRRYDEASRSGHSRIGIMAREVYNRQLWRLILDPSTGLPCSSFRRWVTIAAPYSHATVYAAMSDIVELKDVPDEDLAQMSHGNIGTMMLLSTAVRADPDVIAAAKSDKPEAFIKRLQQSHPEQHLEPRKPMRLAPTESQRAAIDDAVALATLEGASSLTEAVEMMAIEYAQARIHPVPHMESDDAPTIH